MIKNIRLLLSLKHCALICFCWANIFMLSGCPFERWFPQKVANGIARLTVANLGLMLLGIKQIKHEDLSCDLLADKPFSNFQQKGQKGEIGTIHWQFQNCLYDFKNGTMLFDENQKPIGTLFGKVIVSGEKIMTGYLTGNENFPVIPEGSTSLSFRIEKAIFQNYKATLPNISEYLEIINGDISFEADIHLATSKSLSLCSRLLPNVSFKNIIYNPSHQPQDALIRLPGIFCGHFDVEIKSSNFSAQQNQFKDQINSLNGTITLWDDQPRKVPSDGLGLNPSFDSEIFAQELEAIDDLDLPVHYNCSVHQFIATQTSRLLIQNVGNMVFDFGNNKDCGPKSAWIPYWHIVRIEDSKWKIETTDCKLINDKPSVLDTDCNENITYVSGNATITGQTLISGEFSIYNRDILRKEPHNLTFNLQKAMLENYTTYDLMAQQKAPKFQLIIKNGTLSGRISPLFAEDKSYPCLFTQGTPIAAFKNISLKNAQTTLLLNLKDIVFPDDLILNFELNISDTNLSAQNGFFQNKGNYLSGNIAVNGKKYELDTVQLNPFYNQETFNQTYACKVKSILPPLSDWDPTEHCKQ